MNPSYTVPAMPAHPQGGGGPHALSTRQYLTDLSTSLFSFVLPLLPTAEELATKEEVRVLIERLIKTIEPSSRLASFGSSCNSFGLRNSGEYECALCLNWIKRVGSGGGKATRWSMGCVIKFPTFHLVIASFRSRSLHSVVHSTGLIHSPFILHHNHW